MHIRDHNTPRAYNSRISASVTPRRSKISALCWPRGDGSHPHTVADRDRGTDVRHLAQLGIARILHEPAVADLRVGEHLCVVVDRAAGHTS